jgi:RNA-binding protein Nova
LQLSADDKFGSYMELTLQLASTQGLIPAMRSSGARSALAPVKAQLQLWLLDEDVGAVLGKRGQTLTQIQQVSGFWVKCAHVWGRCCGRGARR